MEKNCLYKMTLGALGVALVLFLAKSITKSERVNNLIQIGVYFLMYLSVVLLAIAQVNTSKNGSIIANLTGDSASTPEKKCTKDSDCGSDNCIEGVCACPSLITNEHIQSKINALIGDNWGVISKELNNQLVTKINSMIKEVEKTALSTVKNPVPWKLVAGGVTIAEVDYGYKSLTLKDIKSINLNGTACPDECQAPKLNLKCVKVVFPDITFSGSLSLNITSDIPIELELDGGDPKTLFKFSVVGVPQTFSPLITGTIPIILNATVNFTFVVNILEYITSGDINDIKIEPKTTLSVSIDPGDISPLGKVTVTTDDIISDICTKVIDPLLIAACTTAKTAACAVADTACVAPCATGGFLRCPCGSSNITEPDVGVKSCCCNCCLPFSAACSCGVDEGNCVTEKTTCLEGCYKAYPACFSAEWLTTCEHICDSQIKNIVNTGISAVLTTQNVVIKSELATITGDIETLFRQKIPSIFPAT